MFLVAILSSIVGGLILILTFVTAKGAPQEAAGAALAMCFAVIPYVIARCIQLPQQAAEQKRHHAALIAALERMGERRAVPAPVGTDGGAALGAQPTRIASDAPVVKRTNWS